MKLHGTVARFIADRVWRNLHERPFMARIQTHTGWQALQKLHPETLFQFESLLISCGLIPNAYLTSI
jgi:hypothetical protein